MADAQQPAADGAHGDGETRRDFLMLATGAFVVGGGALAAWPLIDQMNPAADTLAASTTEVDLEPIEVGQSITVTWRGKPVFIRRRTEAEIKDAAAVNIDDLRDPEPDSARVKEGKAEWLILVGVCTHFGCIPKGQRVGEKRGEWNGWFCPCHGSHYDTSGRIRKGPAPTNLPVPTYTFLSDTVIRIG